MEKMDSTHKSIAGRTLANLSSLIACFAIVAAMTLVAYGRWFGSEVSAEKTQAAADSIAPVTVQGAITMVNTTTLGKDVAGYAGPTPILLSVEDGKITNIEPLQNVETPSFYQRALEGILPNYIGKTPQQAANLKVDAVSGATYSSNALKANVQLALHQLDIHLQEKKEMGSQKEADVKFWCVLIVTLAALLVPLVLKNKKYRLVQMLLNVGVLGFWAGSFLSYARLMGLIAGAYTGIALIVPLIMVAAAFIMPLLGKGNRYCAWICPLGSLQEIAGMLCKKKLHPSPKVWKILTVVRKLVWMVLIILVWIGVGATWIDYELFTAFLLSSASWIVIAVGISFIALFVVTEKPFCKYLCPLGTLIRISANTDPNP